MNKKTITTLGVALVGILALGACATAIVQAAQTSEATKPTRIKHVDPSAGATLLAEPSVRVLDIRTPKEFAGGYIGGATNLDFNARDFEQQLTGLDKSRTYLVYCASGRRSTKSLATFEKLGFASIVHLDGGITAWKAAGQPVKTK